MKVNFKTFIDMTTSLILLFMAASGTSKIIHVPGDYTTIQSAINEASDGDTVLIEQGTYSGTGNRDIGFLGKAVTVRSEKGPDVTAVDCELLGRGFYIHQGESEDSRLEGLTILNGNRDNTWPDNKGGGILCWSASPSITNCRILNNKAGKGGGLFFYSSSATLTDCTIESNISAGPYGDGGGIICYKSPVSIIGCVISSNSVAGGKGGGLLAIDSDTHIENCVFSQNQAEVCGGGIYFTNSSPVILNCRIEKNSTTFSSGNGGGIYCIRSKPIIRDCELEDNSAAAQGGGLYLTESSPQLNHCIIDGNSAGFHGGGLYCDSGSAPYIKLCTFENNLAMLGGGISCWNYSNPHFHNCKILNNQAVGGEFEGHGGGISSHTSKPALYNCVFSGNTASGKSSTGGGLYGSWRGLLTLENCTITGNFAGTSGGALSCETSNAKINNCILWGDSPNEIHLNPLNSSEVHVTYSDVSGGWAGLGNLQANPEFGFYKGLHFILLKNSPCVDSGDPSILDKIYDWHPNWPKGFTDAERSDMGAYGGPENVNWF